MGSFETTKSDQKVFRIFVEKRNRFNVDAQNMFKDLKMNLNIEALTSLRLLNRYDIQGINEEAFHQAIPTVFAQPNTDKYYLEDFNPGDNYSVFAMDFLAGQYDQREDSAAQILQILTGGERPTVSSARLVCLGGDFSKEDFDRIKAYLINPVEARIAPLEKPESLILSSDIPTDVEAFVDFINYEEADLKSFWKHKGFAMSFGDLEHCQKYFRDIEKRDPFVTELKVIDTYWSDHCRHTTFLTQLDKIEIEESRLTQPIRKALEEYQSARRDVYGERIIEKNISLMDIATMGMRLLKKQGKLIDLDESEEINACSIKVPIEIDGKTEEWLIQFKNETHNHPTEIEPFGGASTCLGGAIRDPLSGRAYVYQAMRITGSGNPFVSVEETLDGKLPTFQITKTAAEGYSSYGNQIGIASGYLRELYDDGYVAKRMELGAVVSACPARNVVRETPLSGDVIILVGGKTGRDGCGGATGSSKAHSTESSEVCSAEVQKGCPPIERNIQRLFRKPEVSTLIKRCNDFGAGGVCVAIGELADGLEIHLDKIQTKYDGLNGTELAISESQERMAVVIDKSNIDQFIAAANEENLEATPVATVSDTNRLVVWWQGNIIVDISRDFLNTNGVTQHASALITAPNEYENYRAFVPSCLSVAPVDECFKTNLSRLKVASQNGLMSQFDSTVGGNTVNLPLGGKYQLSPEEAMIAKIPLEKGFTDDATAMSFGYIPGISRWSPFHGSAFAVTQSLARLAAVGAPIDSARLTFQEYFESLRNEPARWGKPVAALLGAFTAQKGFGTPSIGGKDSMSGSFNDIDVPPTLVSFAVSLTKASKTGSTSFKKPSSLVAFLPLPLANDSYLPDYESASKLFNKISELVCSGEILSASVVDEGGSAASVSKMCFGNKIGFSFTQNIERTTLFAPLCGSFVVELKEGDLCLAGLDYCLIGSTIEEQAVIIENIALPLDELIESWTSTLEPIFPTKHDNDVQTFEAMASYKSRSTEAPSIKKAKPRVFIPIFAGTNGEYETIKAFEKAGAEVSSLVFKNLTPEYIVNAFGAMVSGIENSETLALAGGMTLGNEPDGAGKLISNILRHSAVAEAVQNLIENRKGLILGLGDGFNALLRTGLITEGKFTELDENSPAFVKNALGRHVSTTAYTKVTSVLSPWHAGVNWGELYTQPLSSGEGRLVAPSQAIELLVENGQIASRFTDCDGKIAADNSRWNPMNASFAIESLTSPCGRILGKMGLVERCGENLLRNVPGKKDMKIFESGVNYWK